MFATTPPGFQLARRIKSFKQFRLPVLIWTIVAQTLVCFGQAQPHHYTRRENERRGIHYRDSLMQSLNSSDTSINSQLQRIEQYTTSFDQIKNSLAEGIDTSAISAQLPLVTKRLNKIGSLITSHKSSTLRYLFVLRTNLDHIQNELDSWQSDLQNISSKLIQNQSDLLKFAKDSLIKAKPTDSLIKKKLFLQRKQLWKLWSKTNKTNRAALTGVSLLQNEIATAYTQALDENDQVDSQIKDFALKAVNGESDLVWNTGFDFSNFKNALARTNRLNGLLFNLFLKQQVNVHLISVLFLVILITWLLYTRHKALSTNEDKEVIIREASFVYRRPIVSALLVVLTIVPYFYDHPPTVFTELMFIFPIMLSLVLVKGLVLKPTFRFLLRLLGLTIIFGFSNLFIEATNIDRLVILVASLVAAFTGWHYYNRLTVMPKSPLPYATLIAKIFIILQVLSALLNISGRFSLAKIVAVTAVFNLWMLIILYLVTRILWQWMFLHLQIKRSERSLFNWMDIELILKKTNKTVVFAATLLWLFFLFQNLCIDDWASDYFSDLLGAQHNLGGATFTFGGFVIFILIIWLSSIVSKIISYFYDVSSARVSDLSILKRKNRTSALIIRMGVFTAGFLLAVAASGFPLDKLTIIISAFGVGIGFGMQNIVNNLVSGLILAFEKPIQVGDFIEVSNHSGTMKEIGIRSSRVMTEDGSEIIIPNGDLISQQVTNWTLSNNNRRIDFIVGVAYGSDLAKAQQLLNNILSGSEDVMQTPPPITLVVNFNDSSVDFKLLFWISDNLRRGSIKSRLYHEIYKVFEKEGIEIPYPKRDVQLFFPQDDNSIAEAAKEALSGKNKPTAEKPKQNRSDQDQ